MATSPNVRIALVAGTAVALASAAVYMLAQPKPRRLRSNPRKKSRYPGYVVQSILVPISRGSQREALVVARRHGFKSGKSTREKNYYHFRVASPAAMVSGKYVTLRLPSGTLIRKALPKAASVRRLSSRRRRTISVRRAA